MNLKKYEISSTDDLITFKNNDFFNASLKNINYDIDNSKIKLVVELENSKIINIYFKDILRCEIIDYNLCDKFGEIQLYFTKIDKNKYLYFATEKEEPLIYIISRYVFYSDLS